MKITTTCPCCSNPMLHHLRNNREYWFCRKCWQEMPVLAEKKVANNFNTHKIVNLSTNLAKRNKAVLV